MSFAHFLQYLKLGKMSQNLSSAAVMISALRVRFEPVSSKRYKLACRSTENWDYAVRSESSMRTLWVVKGPTFLHAEKKD